MNQIEKFTVVKSFLFRARVINREFRKGMRLNKLESQPSPWVKDGLRMLEDQNDFTPDDVKGIDRSGGTDHPDPWFT